MLEREDLLELRTNFLNLYVRLCIMDVRTEISGAELWDHSKPITPEHNKDFDYLKKNERFILNSKNVFLYRKLYLISTVHIQGIILSSKETTKFIAFTVTDGSENIKCILWINEEGAREDYKESKLGYGSTIQLQGKLEMYKKLIEEINSEVCFYYLIERDMVQRERLMRKHREIDKEATPRSADITDLYKDLSFLQDIGEEKEGEGEDSEMSGSIDMKLLEEILNDEKCEQPFSSSQLKYFSDIDTKRNVKSLIMLNLMKGEYYSEVLTDPFNFTITFKDLAGNNQLLDLCINEFKYSKSKAKTILQEIIISLEQIGFLLPIKAIDEQIKYAINHDIFNNILESVRQMFENSQELKFHDIKREIISSYPDTFSDFYIYKILDNLAESGYIQEIAKDPEIIFRKRAQLIFQFSHLGAEELPKLDSEEIKMVDLEQTPKRKGVSHLENN